MRIDPIVGETLLNLQEIVNKKQEIERDQTLSPIEKSEKIQELKFKVTLRPFYKKLILLGVQH